MKESEELKSLEKFRHFLARHLTRSSFSARAELDGNRPRPHYQNPRTIIQVKDPEKNADPGRLEMGVVSSFLALTSTRRSCLGLTAVLAALFVLACLWTMPCDQGSRTCRGGPVSTGARTAASRARQMDWARVFNQIGKQRSVSDFRFLCDRLMVAARV